VLESVIGNDWGWVLLRAPHIFFSFFFGGEECVAAAEINSQSSSTKQTRIHVTVDIRFHFIFSLLYFSPMDHKAHRSAQSGAKAVKKDRAKGKEKQLAFNPKVLSMLFFNFRLIHHLGICT